MEEMKLAAMADLEVIDSWLIEYRKSQ
jgi:hypothetical protein